MFIWINFIYLCQQPVYNFVTYESRQKYEENFHSSVIDLELELLKKNESVYLTLWSHH